MSPRPAVLLLAPVLAAGCQVVPKVAAIPRLATRDVQGDFLITSGPSSSGADVESMGLEEDEDVFYPRVDVSWLGLDAWFSTSDALYEGEGTLEQTFDLGGVTIVAGDDVRSRLDLTSTAAAVTWDFVPSDLVDVGLGIGVAYFDFDAEIESLTSGDTIMTQQDWLMPVVAARIESEIGPLRANVVGSGLTGTYDGAEGTYYDVDAFLEYHLSDLVGFRLGIVLGYNATVFDFEYEDDDGSVVADLRFDGPYVGLTLGN